MSDAKPSRRAGAAPKRAQGMVHLDKSAAGKSRSAAKRTAGVARPVKVLEPRARDAAHLLKILASEQRLTILCRLSEGEMSVGDLGAHVPLSQSALSQHLAKLRAEKIVETRRVAQTIYYRLKDPVAERLIGFLCDLYSGSKAPG